MSIDSAETPAAARARKETVLAHGDQRGVATGWHFLTGRQQAIDTLATAVGFRYARDPRTGQLAHPAAVLVLAPDGTLARVLQGLEFPPRDLRLALVEAADGRIGTAGDAFALLCVAYDGARGTYTPQVRRLVTAVCLAFLAALAVGLRALRRAERGRPE